MNRKIIFLIVATAILLSGCSFQKEEIQVDEDVKIINEDNNEENTGEEEKIFKKIAPEDAKKIMEDIQYTIVDVRTPDEFKEAHIENALLLPLDEIEKSASEILKNKNRAVFLYCRSGSRSARAAQLLSDMGYKKVYDMGGIIDWKYGTVSDTVRVIARAISPDSAIMEGNNNLKAKGLGSGEYLSIEIYGEIKNLKSVELEYVEDGDDYKFVEKNETILFESLRDQIVIIETIRPEGIPSEKIAWENENGESFGFIVSELELSDDGENLWIVEHK